MRIRFKSSPHSPACLLAIFLSFGFVCAPLFAQAPERTASITFQVQDQTNAVIPKARVRIVPYDATSKLTTGPTGKITVALEPGNYEVLVNSPGFKTYKTRVVVSDLSSQTISIVMMIGSGGGPEVVQLEYSPDEETLLKLEDSYWRAVESFDFQAYKDLWNPKAISWSGQRPFGTNEVTQWISANRVKGLHLEEFGLGMAGVRVVGNTGVTLYGVTALWVDKLGRGEPTTTRISHTWSKVGDKWQIVGELFVP